MIRSVRCSIVLLVVSGSALGAQVERGARSPESGAPSVTSVRVAPDSGLRASGSADARIPASESARVGVRASRTSEPPPPPRPADTSRNRALMAAGGAALLVGLIIADDAGTLLAVGGAVVGLYGLFRFLE